MRRPSYIEHSTVPNGGAFRACIAIIISICGIVCRSRETGLHTLDNCMEKPLDLAVASRILLEVLVLV